MKRIMNVLTMGLMMLIVVYTPLKGESPVKDPGLDVEPPILIDQSENLYQAGDFFLAGQPHRKTFDSLYSTGLKMVINLRTDEEMEAFSLEQFDEKEYVEEIGLDYVQVPMGGAAGFTPEAISAIDEAIKKTKGKVLIHCRSAGRATLAWMAWLIRYNDYTIDQAVDLGKQAQFSFPLEDLLGYPVTFQKAASE